MARATGRSQALRTRKMLGLALAAMMLETTPGLSTAAYAQHFFDQGTEVNGYNARRADYNGGFIAMTGDHQWTENHYNQGRTFHFQEQNRDEWSVYLFDPSRNVHVQLDFHRRKFRYQPPGQPMTDLYDLTGASIRPGGNVNPGPPPGVRVNIQAGPIWNQGDAVQKCNALANSVGGRWTGAWRTTIQGQMSVCEVEFRRR